MSKINREDLSGLTEYTGVIRKDDDVKNEKKEGELDNYSKLVKLLEDEIKSKDTPKFTWESY